MANVDSSLKSAIIPSLYFELNVFCHLKTFLNCQGIEIIGADMCSKFELINSLTSLE